MKTSLTLLWLLDVLGGSFDTVPVCLSATTYPERQRRCAGLSVTPIPQPLPPQRLKGRQSREHRSCNVLPATEESKVAKGPKRKPHA